MVGASLICALQRVIQRYELNVAVIEAVAPPQTDSAIEEATSYDARSTALSWGSRNLFHRLGLWQALAPGATAIKHIHVSDRGHFGAVQLHAQDYAVEALGYVVENQWLGQVFYGALAQQPNLDIFCPARVLKVTAAAECQQVSVVGEDGPFDLTCSLLVVADGGRSELCAQLGFVPQERDYEQNAIIANLCTEVPHQNRAFERFTPQGPMALLPLNERGRPEHMQNRSALVFSVPRVQEQELLAQSDEDFLRCLQDAFGYRLGRFEHIGARFSYPLKLQWLNEPIRPGVVVLGNAAHSLHPVAGQGFNLALRATMQLADLLGQAYERGLSPASLEILSAYQRARRADQKYTMGLSDQLVRIFSSNDLMLSMARDFGLLAMSNLPLLKRAFAHQAMGLQDERVKFPEGMA